MLDAPAIFRALEQHSVDYVLVGGMAAVLYGSPIPTGDIDICPDTSSDNLERLAAALEELQAKEWEPHKGDYLERPWSSDYLASDRVWLLVTRFGQLDLTFDPGGTDGYDDLIRNAVEMRIEDVRVPTADLADIIRSKEAVRRERDLRHLPTLIKLQERRARKGLRPDE